MNEIILFENTLPVLRDINFCVTPVSFVHMDRIADFHVLIYVTSGQITVTEENIDYEINENELLFLKRQIRHYGKTRILPGTAWYYIHFETAPIPAASQACITLPKNLYDTAQLCPAKLQAILDHFREESPRQIWQNNLSLLDFLLTCAFYRVEVQASPPTLGMQIAEYLEAVCQQPFSALKIEQHFFLSYKHLAAVFKREKGSTMQQYHTKCRMQIACNLLRSTLLPVGEISNQLGYADSLYFSRCFHQTTGMSPTAYRRTIPYHI